MTVERFEDLDIWQDARALAKKVFDISTPEPCGTDYRSRDQLRSSAGSISDNIAEGFERGGNKEFIQFLFIAKGSCGETRSQLYRACDFGYINKEELATLLTTTENISKRISSLIKYLQDSKFKGAKYH